MDLRRKTTQWRFHAPTHVVAAFALRRPVQPGRNAGAVGATANCDTLIDGMAGLGFRTFRAQRAGARDRHLPRAARPRLQLQGVLRKVKSRGYILYPGKLTQVETFRVGCIGAIDANEMRNVVSAVSETLKEMRVQKVAPAKEAAAA